MNFEVDCSYHLEPALKLEKTTEIKRGCIQFMCILKDGRIALNYRNSDWFNSRNAIYNKNTYISEILIQEFERLCAICGLRNGNLASSGWENIKIYEIGMFNYKLIYKLKKDQCLVFKLIELENDKLCSCSYSQYKIQIWDSSKNYECIQTLTGLEGHPQDLYSILEMNDYIITINFDEENALTMWNKSTYQPIKKFNLPCISYNELTTSKLKDNKVIFGGFNKLYILDVLSNECKPFIDEQLKNICSICVLRDDKVLIGNETGEILCFDPSSYQIIFTKKMHEGETNYILENEDNQIVSFSNSDGTFNIYSIIDEQKVDYQQYFTDLKNSLKSSFWSFSEEESEHNIETEEPPSFLPSCNQGLIT